MRDGASEFLLTSTLQGLALQLPAPLAKAADEAMPLRVEKKIVLREARPAALRRGARPALARARAASASAAYVRDISGGEPRVLRGGIGIGLAAGESAPPPERGVLANIQLARLDVAAWQALFSDATGKPPEAAAAGGAAPTTRRPTCPPCIAVRAQELAVGGRTLHNVVLGGTRDGALWRANVDAAELSGYAEYRQRAGRAAAMRGSRG